MAITFQVANGFGSTSNALDAGSGTNRIMLFMLINPSNTTRPTAPTFNGTSSTFIMEDTTNSVNFSAWYLIAPATGSHNVVIDAGNSVAVGVYNGATQSAQPDASTNSQSGGSTTSQTNSITTVADNSWAVCTGYFPNGGTISGGTGATQRAGSFGMYINDTAADVHPAGSTSQTVSSTVSQTIGIKLLQVSISPAYIPVNYPITISQGSYTLTGQTLLMSYGRKVVLAVGSYTYTGFSLLFTYFQKWIKQAMNTSTMANGTKNSSSFSTQSKNSSSMTNGTKNSSTWVDQTKNNSTMSNDTKH